MLNWANPFKILSFPVFSPPPEKQEKQASFSVFPVFPPFIRGEN
jgi:hypothetical protein